MFSRFFIERPIFAAVVSIVISLIGILSVSGLPIEQYPTIAPVQVQVTANYPGADAQTAAQTVAAPIEQQITGVDNLLYMSSSSSSSGNVTITAFFDLATDPDIAQVQVQNRVNLATPQLPQIVTQAGVSVQKKSSSILMVLTITDQSGSMNAQQLDNYTNVNIMDAIKRVPGAGQAAMFGAPNQAIRVWLNPRNMAALGVTTTDVKNAISAQNALVGAGQIGQAPSEGEVQMTFPVVTDGAFSDLSMYEEMILKASQGSNAVVRLKDVARVEFGRQYYSSASFFNGKPTSAIGIYLQPGANALDVSDAVRKTLDDMKATFPKGVEYTVALDTTDFVRDSIKEVIKTLIEAMVLVIVVIYLFLQNLRATLIAAIAIVVSLLGGFIGLYALGFSINLLTLFGLILAIGLVVDDAIVVIENVEKMMHDHPEMSPKEASIASMEEVSGAVISMTLVLSAVFIPALFISGTTGQLYKQFAATIASGVLVSGISALTLTPMLCALLLKRSPPPTKGPFAWFNRWFDRTTKAYGRLSHLVIRKAFFSLLCLAVMLLGLWQLFRMVPSSFVPQEDQGYMMAALIMPEAASLQRSIKAGDEVDRIIRSNPEIQFNTMIDGFSLLDGQVKSNAATAFIGLKPFKERPDANESVFAIAGKIGAQSQTMTAGTVIPIVPPPIPGIGTQGGFELWIQNRGTDGPEQMQQTVQRFIQAASKRPELGRMTSTFNANSPQLKVTIDRARSNLIGVPVNDVLSTLQAQFGSLRASQFNQFSRVWDVTLQSEAKYRQTPEDIAQVYTRSQSGEMVPLSALVDTRFTNGPALMSHFNSFPAAQVTGSPAPGYSSGEAIKALQETAAEVLPTSYSYAWSGLSYSETTSGNDSVFIFVLGMLMVFLILAAMFESWALPAAVISAVPFGLLGALFATWLRGLNNDVYMQIGLLVLVGLAAKNAILIVEFAVIQRQAGKSLIESAVDAGELRLRAIVMTSLAFIFGTLPLALATGSGANSRHSIGTGIVGGMILLTSLALIFVPLFYYLFERWREKGSTSDSSSTAAPAVSGKEGQP
ncbi:multidrug efflux RND transporter permease subunit [Craterilacuibacter sp. RT1T]|uniref:efflux RND transporter permease subunit n=1 Tax=Craterilacuibacter sp. RT1T TaxID=2942211 RepID=UPI0020C15F59|nr:multidrug efflux RND transporter permease subunit [Craterilacuibacter sp. RT1T]MCL6264555.1 multidrug efflux RND transporter permease subunit [Craterilacuibacter sp. RT1T]